MALPRITDYPLPTAAELPQARGPWRPGAIVSRCWCTTCSVTSWPHSTPARRRCGRPWTTSHACWRIAARTAFRCSTPLSMATRTAVTVAFRLTCGAGHAPQRRSRTHHRSTGTAAREHVLVKHRYSAFQRSNLETLMRVRGRDQLLVTGVYAHIGCTATVVEAFQRDIEAFIAADAVADFSRADHDQALHWIARTCGVPMTTDQLLEVL